MQKNIHFPTELATHAALLGADLSLVQGPGGNVSIKHDGVMWIKASGTRMSEAIGPEIFVPLDLEKAARLAFLDDSSRMLDAMLVGSKMGLRPSIETAMHAVLPSRVVSHVHSIGAISVAILDDPSGKIDEISDSLGIAVVPYLRPGAPLARAIQNVIEPHHNALLLGNHGLTVWGDSFAEVEEMINLVETSWREDKQDHDRVFSGQEPAVVSEYWLDTISQGILLPDEAVLLGHNPFKTVAKQFVSSDIEGKDALWSFGNHVKSDVRDLGNMLLLLGDHVKPGSKLNFLSEHEIAELLDWDMEKFRQEMSK